jgi:hypothetical protein
MYKEKEKKKLNVCMVLEMLWSAFMALAPKIG